MAEGERFELSVGYKPTPVFKTGAINRSATPPLPERRILPHALAQANLREHPGLLQMPCKQMLKAPVCPV